MNPISGFCTASMAIPVLLAIATSPQAVGQCDLIGWSQVGGATNNPVAPTTARIAIGTDLVPPDSHSIYVGGDFSMIAGVAASRIARWDGRQWTPLSSGLTGGPVLRANAMVVFDDGQGAGPQVYVGGAFSTAGGIAASNIARWNGNSWSAVGLGLSSQVNALTVFDDGFGNGTQLYAAGNFGNSGGMPMSAIARWNGTTWEALGEGLNNVANVLAVFDDDEDGADSLYVAGLFTTAGGVAAQRIAKWDGQNWTALGGGVDGAVLALAGIDDGPLIGLYAGGEFSTAGGASSPRIARWDGQVWSPLSGAELINVAANRVRALAFEHNSSGSILYVAGDAGPSFPILPSYHQSVVQWDGQTWASLGIGMHSESVNSAFRDVHGLALDHVDSRSSLLVLGQFSFVSGMPSGPIASWTPAGAYQDRNLNRIEDDCDIASSYSEDCNANGLPDEAESPWRYRLDSGFGAEIYGQTNSFSWIYMKQFTVKPGAEVITHVGMAWSPLAVQGHPSKALIYSDPNNDGNPLDAILLAQVDAGNMWTMNTNNDLEFAIIPVGTVHVGPPGTSFFVGGFVSAAPNTWMMVADSQPSMGRSFVRGYSPGMENLEAPYAGATAADPFHSNWRLRALSVDCNINGTPDLCDIGSGTSLDRNGNHVPDECDRVCAGDIAPPPLGDYSVGIADLLFVIAHWGTASGPTDINNDGTVNLQDLLAVIAAWGPCD